MAGVTCAQGRSQEGVASPAKERRRNKQKGVGGANKLYAPGDMASEEHTDETGTGDEYVPGKSTTIWACILVIP